MTKQTKNQNRRDEQVYQLTTLVAGKFSLQEVLDKLAEAAVKIISVKACSIRLLDEETGELKMRSTYGLSEEYRNKGVVSKNDTVIKAAFDGEAILVNDMRTDDRIKYKQAATKEGIASQLTVAMEFRNKAIGVLRLYSPKPRRFYRDDINLARAVASQCAVAITNAKLYAKAIEGARISEQMRLAGVIQRRMIPQKAPSLPGLDIAATYIPCFDVGGDFYDFFQVNDDCIAIVIADVIGKGIPAAIMTSMFRGAMRAYTDTQHTRGTINIIEEIVHNLNKTMCRECRDGEFVSLFYAIIDIEQKAITYCNCGHEPAVLIRDGQITELEKGGLVLGVEVTAEYDIGTVKLTEGDCLLLYTDGLTDATNFDGELWGRENLLKTTKNFVKNSSEHIVKNILAYRRRFVGLASQLDDTSIIVVKVVK